METVCAHGSHEFGWSKEKGVLVPVRLQTSGQKVVENKWPDTSHTMAEAQQMELNIMVGTLPTMPRMYTFC